MYRYEWDGISMWMIIDPDEDHIADVADEFQAQMLVYHLNRS